MSISIKGKSVHFDDRYLHVELEDDRIILTSMSWYKEPCLSGCHRFAFRGTI
jgi:hypothetical protein